MFSTLFYLSQKMEKVEQIQKELVLPETGDHCVDFVQLSVIIGQIIKMIKFQNGGSGLNVLHLGLFANG